MNKKRPINLDLTSMTFPPMAIASILHRVSGITLFLLLPFILCLFAKSLNSADSFIQMQMLLTHPVYKLCLWGFSVAMVYHIIAGLRHIVMDMGIGEHLSAGRASAILVIALSFIAAIILGIWIW